MRETPSAPAAVQGLLRYFHRSRAACAEKHLCARGTALWTHIRNLMCKGKVGQWVWVSAGLCRAGSLLPDVSVISFPCPFACWLSWPILSSGGERGPVMTILWKGRKGFSC